jgi:hypothetical protein
MTKRKGISSSLFKKIEEHHRIQEAMDRCYGDGPCVGPISDEDLAFSRQQARKLLDEINKNKRKKNDKTD